MTSPIFGNGTRTLIMGVLNVTPDSFSDGGLYNQTQTAVDRALEMIAEGADIIDIGGESTRPSTFRDNAPLDIAEEMRRVIPVIGALRRQHPTVPISIDTYKASVAKAAIDAGATIVNDISALTSDSGMAPLVAGSGVGVVLMHMPGPPRNMPKDVKYGDVVAEVAAYLSARADAAIGAGVARDRIALDPGIGFGKTPAQSFELVGRLSELSALGFPVVSGVSRKSFLAAPLGGAPADDRLEGTAAAVALSIAGRAAIVRVHDVREMVRVARVADAIVRGGGGSRVNAEIGSA